MSSDDGLRRALLSDSEATLRQVRGVLTDFAAPEEEAPEVDPALGSVSGEVPEHLASLVRMLVTTYRQIAVLIDNLRESRGVLEQASVHGIHRTHDQLAEVTSATELAATGILDGIDRALQMVDRLGDDAETRDPAETRAQIRQELHQIMDLLQFQDITSQQLGHATGVLSEIEGSLVELSDMFDAGIDLAGRAGEPLQRSERDPALDAKCDPNATTLDAEGRQALADEIFTGSEAE